MFFRISTFATLALAFTSQTIAAPAAELEARQSLSGDGTYFNPGLGACGTYNTDADAIVAVSHLLYDSWPGATPNPNLNPICGRQLVASYSGRSVVVTVRDKCMGCAGMYDLDFSPTAFTQLADPAIGRLHGVTWNWL